MSTTGDSLQLVDHRINKSEIGPKRRNPILTIGMAVYEGFGDLALTISNLILNHRDAMHDIDILVVDNCPKSKDGEDTRNLLTNEVPHGHYCAFGPYCGTYVKEQVVRAAQTEYVMVMDPHVTLASGSLKKLVSFLRQTGDSNDLFHGPLLSIGGGTHATHMNPAFSNTNFGRWGTYQPAKHPGMLNPDIYEVPLHGMGLFLVRRDAWLGFHPAMHHFGSEEGYLHEKYRLHGRKVWSLPFLGWYHVFRNKSRKILYKMPTEHKYRNMLIGWREVSLPMDYVESCWKHVLKDEVRKPIMDNVDSLNIVPIPRSPDKLPFLGYPLRIYDEPFRDNESYADYEIPLFYPR